MTSPFRRRYTDEELLSELRERSLAAHRTVRSSEMRSPSSQTVIHRFGTWNVALRRAGLTPTSEKSLCSNIRTLSDSDCAYVAGIIDCDGWIGVTACHAIVGICGVEKGFLEHIQRICGGGVIRSNGSGNKWSTRPCYQLVFRVNEMRDLIPQILPRLYIKKNNAIALLTRLSKEESHEDVPGPRATDED